MSCLQNGRNPWMIKANYFFKKLTIKKLLLSAAHLELCRCFHDHKLF